MRYLFVFAHPDDETVACASTIKQLTDRGDSVQLLSATLGDAGEVSALAQAQLKMLDSLSALRESELRAAASYLGADLKVLDYRDGQITNQDVWGSLQQRIGDEIESFKPDFVITFDHTGWYYHLDHVGVSIATTLAYKSSVHRPHALLFSHYQPGGTRWQYVFRQAPATHYVEITDPEQKLRAIELHQSQDLTQPKKFVATAQPNIEIYELAFADGQGKKLLAQHPIFKLIKKKLSAHE